MKFNKGDLIIVNTVSDERITCIVLSIFDSAKYLYVYCVDSGKYRLVYEKEVEVVVEEKFDPTFPVDSGFWDLDYSFYEASAHGFIYSPFCTIFDDDDE